MFCSVCGKQLEDGARNCPVCGTVIPQGYYGAADTGSGKRHVPGNRKRHVPGNGQSQASGNGQSPVSGNRQVPGTENGQIPAQDKGKKKKIVIIAAVVAAIVCIAVVCFVLLRGRSQDKVIADYETALNDKDKDEMLKLMFPKEKQKSGKQLFKDGDIDLVTWSVNTRNKCGNVELKLKSVEEADNRDKELKTDLDDILFDELGIKYDKLVIAQLDASGSKDSGDDLSEVILYKVEDDWYILPGCLQYVDTKRQREDIEQAKNIKSALEACLEDEQVRADMGSYINVAISVGDDLQYLPTSFRNAWDVNISGELKPRYTEYGACDYSFKLDVNMNITVYISSKESVDEWQIVPYIAEEYYTGEISDDDDKTDNTADKEFSYVRLVNENSPLLGYWQGEHCGVYIGYNTTGGTEGFTVYYVLGYQDYGILNHLEWTCSGGNSKIIFENENKDIESYTITVKDENNIVIEDYYDERYELTRQDFDESVREWYAGDWVGTGGGLTEAGDKCSLAVCDECGYLHNVDYAGEYHDNCVIELFNGLTLHYMFPRQGLYVDDFEEIRWYGETYTLKDGGGLYCESYITGDNYEYYEYVKADSEEAQRLEVFNAYKQYIKENHDIDNEYASYCFLYIDDDDIPELIYDNSADGSAAILLTYNDGVVREGSVSCRGFGFYYREKGNWFTYDNPHNMEGDGGAGHIQDGNVVTDHTFDYHVEFDEEGYGERVFTINGKDYSEDEFNDVWAQTIGSDGTEKELEGIEDTLEKAFETFYGE